jgi:hypothetical protein
VTPAAIHEGVDRGSEDLGMVKKIEHYPELVDPQGEVC